jgi:hypothetical protein
MAIDDGVNAVFYMSVITLVIGSIGLCIRMAYKSKCSECSCLCLKIKRNVEIEKEEDLILQPPTSPKNYELKI